MAEHLTILESGDIYDLYAIPVFDEDQKMIEKIDFDNLFKLSKVNYK